METQEIGMDYKSYRKLIVELLTQNKTTGTKQSEELVHYTQLNEQRMNRNEKQFKISEELKQKIVQLEHTELWVVFAEAWCGDCAQNLPILSKIAEESNGKIELKILIKSDNLPLMHAYQNNQAESIPKLIRINKESSEKIGEWGARPKEAQKIAEHWKQNKETISKEDFEKELHLWYAKNRGTTLQNEIFELIGI